jgi:bla regulator protein BlaR1
MNHFITQIGSVLGVSVIHSLWQGLIIWLALRLVYFIYPPLSYGKKYWISYRAAFNGFLVRLHLLPGK